MKKRKHQQNEMEYDQNGKLEKEKKIIQKNKNLPQKWVSNSKFLEEVENCFNSPILMKSFDNLVVDKSQVDQ